MQQLANRGRMIGAIEVTPLWDGPLPGSFDKIPDPAQRAEAATLISQAGPDALTMQVYGFLLKLGERFALVDAGSGRFMSSDLGKLPDALRATGVAPEQIGHVFLTHAHRDHFGGLIRDDGKATFPNAELVLHQTEAEFWLDKKLEDLPPRAHRYFDATKKVLSLYANRMRRMRNDEGVAGVSAHFAPGHTPGHTCWLVQSGGQSLLAWGDLIHLAAIHLPAPHIVMEYDLDPAVALQSRLRVLDWVASDRIPVAGAHLPQPGIGAIVRRGSLYSYEPG